MLITNYGIVSKQDLRLSWQTLAWILTKTKLIGEHSVCEVNFRKMVRTKLVNQTIKTWARIWKEQQINTKEYERRKNLLTTK